MTNRELATVLAALRYWQRHVPQDERVTFEHFDDEAPLDDAEIDDLCEWLNLSPDLRLRRAIDPRFNAPADSSTPARDPELIHEVDLGKRGDGEHVGITPQLAAALQLEGLIVTRQCISTYALTDAADEQTIDRILTGE